MRLREHAPPPYEEVSSHGPRVQLPIGELLSLALDGRSVFSATNPALVYYELSAAPLQATSLTYIVKKVKYRLAGNGRGDDANGRLRTRHDEIYLFRDAYVNFYAPRRIVIDGKAKDGRSYKSVKLSPGLLGWSTCSAAGHFRAKVGFGDRWRNRHQVIWKDDSGRIVAMEDAYTAYTATNSNTGSSSRPDGVSSPDGISSPDDSNSNNTSSSNIPTRNAPEHTSTVPCLKLLRLLDDKDLDLLVTCWTARLWKQSQKSHRSSPPSSMGRSRVKRFAARHLSLRYMTSLVSSNPTPTRRLEA
ncbi:uncharacterized protein TrAtP1_005307 [Trichoderma atroviride]|uniref:Uncharacterized protein n=1 Tax=Hypocrea atroviridis (strain ATCC 20476 / IMI 206040) TaxID=452589 RepID=G9NRT9_HYPAI|nr:uncharacterized protein TRIATDRAFT_317650 [Trichoderma atroviride IMI 206040]EHK46721.1 hypothetical protein TRIATDRAFT_317650 [Trichoderma atroviride IMI 206040]UKZ64088.1 hypothetical protein TrAtP1_005307 [Trichoderma atroviride]